MLDICTSGSTLIQVVDDPLEHLELLPGSYRHPLECFYGLQNSYYSDVYGENAEANRGENSIKNLYLRFRFICGNIVDGKWKPEEEQEVSVFVKEFGCK